MGKQNDEAKEPSDPRKVAALKWALGSFLLVEILMLVVRFGFPSLIQLDTAVQDSILIGWSINLAYVLISIIIYLIQARDNVANHGFDRLVSYLMGFYEGLPDPVVLEEKKSEILKIGAICDNIRTRVTVSDYDAATDTFKVEVRDSRAIRNLFKDVIYRNPAFELSVEPDVVESDPLGMVKVLKLTPTGSDPIEFVTADHAICQSDPGKVFKTVLDIKVAPRGTAQLEFHYWIRQLNGGPFWYSSKIFSADTIISFQNRTGQKIHVALPDANGQQTQPIEIDNNPTLWINVYKGSLRSSEKKFMEIRRIV